MAVKVQHLRSSTASKRPTTTALLDGELSINTNTGTPGVFFEDAAGVIVKVGPAEVGSSAPNATPASGGSAGNSTGEFWLDTANASGNGQQVLKIFDGSSWDYIGKVTVGSTDIELGAAATTTITGLSAITSADINATTSIDLENQADLRFYEASPGTNYVGFQAPAAIATDLLWTLPAADGSSGEVLTTNGSGTLSWSANSQNSISQGDSSVTVTDTGTDGNIAFSTDGSTRWNIDNNGDILPGADSTYDIGAVGNEVLGVYADNLYGTIQTASQTNITGVGTLTAGTWTANTIGIAYGGTGLTATPTNGQVLIGNGTGYTLATITGGTGLTTTNGAGSISIDLDNTAVTPAAYGSSSQVATFTVDQQGRLTAAANVSISITASQVSDFNTAVRTNRLDQMAAPTASVSLNSQTITNLADPVNTQDAATKAYVDATAQGLIVKDSCRAATAAVLPSYTYLNGVITATANGALTVDTSVTVVATDRILVKNETAGNAPYNGIYVVTNPGSAGAPFVLTRAADMDAAAEFAGAFTFVEEGTANADSGWVCTTDNPITVGTTNITFAQFSGAGQITAGDGLSKTGNTLDVNVDSRAAGTKTTAIVSDEVRIDTSWTGQTSLTTLGTIVTGTWNANIIGLAYGGTGVNNTAITQNYALLGPNTGGAGNATFREILTSDIAPVTGGSFDADVY